MKVTPILYTNKIKIELSDYEAKEIIKEIKKLIDASHEHGEHIDYHEVRTLEIMLIENLK